MSLVYRSNITADGSRALDTSSTSTLVFAAFDVSFFLLKKYESNIGAVSGYHRIEDVMKLENLVVAVIVSAVFFATAISFVSAVVLFALVIAAIFFTAVINAAAAVLLVVTTVAVAVISIFVVAVAAH